MNYKILSGILAGLLAISFIYIIASEGGRGELSNSNQMNKMVMNDSKKEDGMMHDKMNNNNSGQSSDSMQEMMRNMTAGLEGKMGDEFDKAFLEEMVIHHQGAIEMANLVLQKSTRPELTNLATNIIDAQTKEISQMKNWLTSWFAK